MNTSPLKIVYGALGVLLVSIPGLCTPMAAATVDGTPTKVVWLQTSVLTTLGPGDEKTVIVNFIASKNVGRAFLQISPEIAPFVRTVPSELRHIRKGSQGTLKIVVAPTANNAVGTFTGSIQLRKGKPEECDSDCDDDPAEDQKLLPDPLFITVNIWPSLVSNDLGIAINVPPGWTAATSSETLNLLPPGAVIDVSVENTGDVLVCVDDNPNNLTPEQFYDGHNQEDLAHDAASIDHLTVAGLSAVRFGGIGAGFTPGDVVIFPLPGRLIRFEQNSGAGAFEQIIQTLRTF